MDLIVHSMTSNQNVPLVCLEPTTMEPTNAEVALLEDISRMISVLWIAKFAKKELLSRVQEVNLFKTVSYVQKELTLQDTRVTELVFVR